MKIFNYGMCVVSALFMQCIIAQSNNPLIHFILDVDTQPVVVSKALNRNGTPHYRAYSFNVINQAGYYRLAGNVSNVITISASNVQLNLGGNTVTGGIIINSNLKNITINNGVIVGSGATGITVNPGCSSIKIFDVSIQDEGTIAGIAMNSVIDSTIRNCEMIQNTTGITLNTCQNITVQNCAATKNTFAGFSLIASTTCVLSGCESISTGATNNFVTRTNALGFVSNNGIGNIFENCIANATQALSTTDSNSLVAGFALRGTEQKSLISRCTASNTATSVAGKTLPYGIVLEATVSEVLTPTGDPVVPLPGSLSAAEFFVSKWSPDGRFLVGTDGSSPFLRIYQFDQLKMTLMQVAVPNVVPGITPFSLAWSPNGQFLATVMNATDDTRIKIYSFDDVNNSLILFAIPSTIFSENDFGVAWHPNGRYLAVWTSTGMRIYVFDSIAKTLIPVSLVSLSGAATSNRIISWSPDGQYVSVANADALYVMKFDQSLNQLITVATGPSDLANNALWNPQSDYIVYVRNNSNFPVQMYAFDRVTNALTFVTLFTLGVNFAVNALDWSPDGKYIAYGNDNGTTAVFMFDVSDLTVTLATPTAQFFAAESRSVQWSPDGSFLAVNYDDAATYLTLTRVLNFPSQNSIDHNTVYCNSGNLARAQTGIGMSGSSIRNYIVQNTVYSNPINPSLVSTNYRFVTNVFNPLFQDVPTLMQNIALGTCAPISTRPDAVQNFEILLSKLTDIATKVDFITLS